MLKATKIIEFNLYFAFSSFSWVFFLKVNTRHWIWKSMLPFSVLLHFFRSEKPNFFLFLLVPVAFYPPTASIRQWEATFVLDFSCSCCFHATNSEYHIPKRQHEALDLKIYVVSSIFPQKTYFFVSHTRYI